MPTFLSRPYPTDDEFAKLSPDEKQMLILRTQRDNAALVNRTIKMFFAAVAILFLAVAGNMALGAQLRTDVDSLESRVLTIRKAQKDIIATQTRNREATLDNRAVDCILLAQVGTGVRVPDVCVSDEIVKRYPAGMCEILDEADCDGT